MNKLRSGILAIFLVSTLAWQPSYADENKRLYTEEYLFVNSYLEALKDYIDISTTAYIIYIQIAPIEKDIYYSEEDILSSAFMKELKAEQESIGSVIRSIKKYTDSSTLTIKNTAQKILEQYEKKKEINTRAQDAYFHIKLRRFKAGISSSGELADEKSDLEPNLFLHMLIHDVLLPENGTGLTVTCEEKDALLKEIVALKTGNDMALQLGTIEGLLSASIRCATL